MILGIIIAAAILALARLLMLRTRRGTERMRALRGFRFAHRGLHESSAGIPENSLSAFARAAARGYGAELDVHLLRDGSLAVFHDSALMRMTGRAGDIEALDAAELKRCFLGGTEETIPQLCEVLPLFEGTGLPLIVELKTYGGNYAALTERTMAELDRFHVPYCVESFDPRCLRWLRRHRPETVRGQLAADFTREHSDKGPVLDYLAAKLLMNFYGLPDFIAYSFEDRRRAPLRLCRRLFGAQIVCWTIRSREDMEQAEREGAMVIFERFIP